MPTARPFYWPQQQQTCWYRPPLNGHGTVLVDEDVYTNRIASDVLEKSSVVTPLVKTLHFLCYKLMNSLYCASFTTSCSCSTSRHIKTQHAIARQQREGKTHTHPVAFVTLQTSGLKPGVRVPPGLHEYMLSGSPKRLISIKRKRWNRSKLEPALIPTLTKIRPEMRCWHARNKFSHLINRSEVH
jgi:hypothetical protein